MIREDARLLLQGLRALIRSQQISERANVACCGMTVAQAATLHALYLEGPRRLGPLSRRLGITPSTLTRNVERIEARGWVERVADAEDARATRLRLTPAGRRQASTIEQQNEAAAVQLLESLSPRRRERVVHGLLDLLEALEQVAGADCSDQFGPIREFLDARRQMK
ncbi:MAG: winged helix-turn-helix transcriptional regulator [bacterium]|nr:winged helix-turn-helix transcriptional regulator [bacterium]